MNGGCLVCLNEVVIGYDNGTVHSLTKCRCHHLGIINDGLWVYLCLQRTVCLRDYILCVCVCVVCVSLCSCMRVHDQNAHQPKYVVKTTSNESRQWQAVSCSENENSTELPDTHVFAALETPQEILICASFMYPSVPTPQCLVYTWCKLLWSSSWVHNQTCCTSLTYCRK